MTDNEKWRDKLSDNEFHICREKGTEPAFSGEYWDKKDSGSYVCKCCGEKLFDSDGKYDSGCGWPSFFQPVDHELIRTAVDNSLSRVRTEIMCEKCGSHLGHVFDDGPEITGQRYCVNSASLNFKGK
ncbi:MAG: peptide-methionine (R)-S-oxide reductase MsrB [Gammaproteobacteria bacterium]|jgi:peptide-methionine (R)-S-oxide reductase|nr:peptide-methionine (R)-S-oxide reductase MsrB [Gammaproteobacteria bacterium]